MDSWWTVPDDAEFTRLAHARAEQLQVHYMPSVLAECWEAARHIKAELEDEARFRPRIPRE